MEIKKVGVIGCGLMGRGIVEVCARAGLPVVVSEINQDFLDKGIEALTTSLTKAAGRGQITEAERDNALAAVAAVLRQGPRPGPLENETRSISFKSIFDISTDSFINSAI